MVEQILLKSIDMYSLNLLNLIYIVLFDFETALENAELTILERVELQMFFASFQPWWRQIKKVTN